MHQLTLIVYVLFAFGSQMLFLTSATACAFEKFADSPHIRIDHSPWVIDTWGQACGFGVSGGMEIRAVNEITHETTTVATFNDITVIGVSSDNPNLLIITLPNLIDMTGAVTELGETRVVYKFTPTDDPEARANFQRWKHHPDDPQARDWYCQNILAKMDPVNRASWNRIIGESYPLDRTTGHKYCPDQ